MSNGQSILNIAGGKIEPIEYPGYDLYKNMDFLLNLDQMYLNSIHINEVIKAHKNFFNITKCSTFTESKYYSNWDIYDFLERYHILFDGISMYRFLEHVPKVKILYFLYILSTTIRIGGYVDVIVPNYEILAERILSENVKSKNFEAEDIITTFELLNEPYCPHASIWTEKRIKHFFELEKRFKIIDIRDYNFDGRDLYLRFLAKRIK